MRQKTGRFFFLLMGALVGSAFGCNLSAGSACAQATPNSGAAKQTPPASSQAEKTLAQEITAKPLEEALKAIAAADSSLMTEGLYNAFRDIAQRTSNEDPQRAVEIYTEDEAVAVRAGLPILAADAHLNQAQGMVAAGEIGDSIAVFGQTLNMYRAAGAPPKKIVAVYLNRAIALLPLGDFPAAIDDDNHAMQIAKEANDEVGVARAENGLGNAWMKQGNFQEAETSFSDALRLARAHGEKLGEAFVLNNMSILRSVQSDYPGAIRYAEQALEIKRQAGSKANLANSMINLADFYHNENRDRDAYRMLDEAAEIGNSLKDSSALEKATAEKGLFQLEAHHFEEALKLLQESRKARPDGADILDQIQTLGWIGEAYMGLKDDKLALQFFEEASAQADTSGMLQQISDIAMDEGRLYFHLGRLEEARRQLEKCIEAVEKMRNNVSGGAADRRRFLSGRTDPFRLLAVIHAKQGNWRAALESSERGKGRILLDVFTGNGLGASVSLTDEERAQEVNLRREFLSLDMQSERAAADPAKKADLDLRLKDARTALETFRSELYVRHPDLRLRRADFSAATMAELQALLPDRNTAFLEYELTPVGKYLFVVTRGSEDSARVNGFKLAVSDAELEKRVNRFHESLASRDPEFSVEAKWLYNALLQPAQTVLKGKSSLLIVPDGNLWRVPFQALQQPDGAYLIEHASIAYTPSLTVSSALKKTAPKRRSTRTLLAMGNPDEETPTQAEEVRALEQLYGAKSSQAYVGKEATLNQFRKSSATADIVHVAAHGIFNDREPMSSHMILASASDTPQAGWLRAREIQSMQLHAELVVLSGCETGQGAFEEGEGLLGMSWAVLAAGARGSLASAWRVEATSTTQMMIAFHQQILHGVNKAEALRRSEINLIHSEKYKHPFYWAGFVFVGDAA